MSGLFGGGKKATSHATRAMGIDFQGAQYGPVIPVVYGRNKVPGNCIWYGDFQSHAQQQKAGKGGGGGGTTNYTYSASAQMGLCEGPLTGLRTVYDGTSVVNLSSINYAFASGAIGQAPWSHLSGSAALGYSLTAIFSFQNLDLGSQASLPNYNYEVNGLKQFSGGIPDANPKDILSDICSDPYHGVNFPYLGDLTQYSNYCVANGLFLSPVYDQQQSANQALSDLFKYTNAYVYYSEDQLKVVPLGDTAVTGNGATFTPNVTPVVNLGTDDFIPDGEGGPSISIDRKAPQDNLNLVRVEFKDRANTYHDSAAVAAIDEDIITNGGRSDDSETVNGCTSATVARFIAQNLVQRAFYVRNTYQFKLSWRYCYLEPTDIVTLTDASLGLNLYPVRITEIEEDGGSLLTVTAEEFPEGIGHSAIYNTQPNGGTNIDQNADPGAVNPPFLFRGPGFLIGNNTPEIWCAVNGSDPMWAGCEVHLSHDGTSYTFAGTVASQARYGSLNAALAVGADPDTVNTPTVQVYAPGELLGGSQTDADNFVTLAMIDSEVIAYETAALQAANTYKLGYLRRGGYGSTNMAHNAGAPFVRLDDSIFRIPVDPSLIGSTVYLKFLSINAFGRTPRTLADETAYTYVVGTNVELPDVPDVPTGFAVMGVADGVSVTWTNDNPAAVGCTSIERATASGGPWIVLAQVGPTTTAYHDSFTNGATYYYRARARGPLVQSGWSTYTDVFSSTGVDVSTIANTANTALDQLGNLSNSQYLQNPFFATGDLTGWTVEPGVTGWGAQNVQATSPNPAIPTYVSYYAGSATNTALRNKACNPCQQGDVVTATCQVACQSGGGNGYVRIIFYNASSQELSGGGSGNQFSGNASGTSRATATAPAGAVFFLVAPAVAGYTTGVFRFTAFTMSLGARSLDDVPDSSTRFAAAETGADKTAGKSLTLLADRNLDNIADSATYLRSIQQAGNAGAITIDNANFQLPATVGLTPNGATIHMQGSSPPPAFGTQYLVVQPTAEFGGSYSTRHYACNPGDKISVGGLVYNGNGGGSSGVGIVFFNAAAGQVAPAILAGTQTAAWTSVSNSGIVPSGAAYFVLTVYNSVAAAFCLCNYIWCTVNDVRIAGSGATIGDQRNLLPVTWAGVRSVNSTSPITYTYTWNAGAGLYNISVNVAAYTLYAGTFSVSYAASSLSGTQQASTTVSAYYYYIDPTSSGGSLALHFTTDPSVLAQQNGIVFIGYATLTTPAAGGGTGGGSGSGGGGFCVGDEMFIGEGRRAGDAEIGDPFDCLDLPTAAGKHVRALQGVSRGVEECVRMITSDGCALVCSVSTPFDLPDGRNTTAPHMLGEQVITDLGVATVISLALIGPRPVTRAHLGGVSYAAGADPARRIYSHNVGSVSKP